jgi:hypothetical protein
LVLDDYEEPWWGLTRVHLFAIRWDVDLDEYPIEWDDALGVRRVYGE